MTATPSSREALAPSLVMDGAMKPIIMRGTQKVMSWPMMYCRVTMIFMTPSETPGQGRTGMTRPQMIPMAMPKSRRKGRLLHSFFIISSYF